MLKKVNNFDTPNKVKNVCRGHVKNIRGSKIKVYRRTNKQTLTYYYICIWNIRLFYKNEWMISTDPIQNKEFGSNSLIRKCIGNIVRRRKNFKKWENNDDN